MYFMPILPYLGVIIQDSFNDEFKTYVNDILWFTVEFTRNYEITVDLLME